LEAAKRQSPTTEVEEMEEEDLHLHFNKRGKKRARVLADDEEED